VSGSQDAGLEGVDKAWRPPMPGSQRWAEPLVARLASEVWRLKRRLARLEATSADDERLRPLRDSVARLEDVFAEYRVQIVEHEGQPYDPGLQVEVLHARDSETDAVIVETIRPTVLLEGRVLQQAQVVIGPAGEEGGER
jgi:hypothetical protein